MFKRIVTLAVTFITASIGAGCTILIAILDYAGRADVIRNLGAPGTISAKIAERLLESPLWLPASFTVLLFVGWAWICYKLLLLPERIQASGQYDNSLSSEAVVSRSPASVSRESVLRLNDSGVIPTQPILPPLQPKIIQRTSKDIAFFYSIVNHNNGLVAQSLLKPYVGMKLKYSAILNNMAPAEAITSVALDMGPGSILICQYSSIFSDYLSRLDKGELVEGSGVITNQTFGKNLVLTDCQPADDERPSLA